MATTATALIFGAGKTGRGFAAHLAHLGGYELILIDKDPPLVSELRAAGRYDIRMFDEEGTICTIRPAGVFAIDDPAWHAYFAGTSLVFTAVFGNNLEALAASLRPGFEKRYSENPEQFLTIITCENFTDAAGVLKQGVLGQLAGEKAGWVADKIGFSESIILRTCLDAGPGESPLTVRAQDYFELPCDGDALKEVLPVYGLKPMRHFADQLRRKIYTYNCINAVITYLGAQRGYTQLYEAGNDAEILAIAEKAACESSIAQLAEFGFDSEEQRQWVSAAFAKFADRNIPDPIGRNGADPARKLGKEDRLIGPARLALKYGIQPEGLLKGILACFAYHDPDKKLQISDLILQKGLPAVLQELCGLSMRDELAQLIEEQLFQTSRHGKE
jgi:mannitol-1-phosphate 5-dehydrogenase